MDPWTALLARATAERQLAAEGRWEELAESTAERVRMAAALGPAPIGAKLVLEALAVVQAELTATIAAARAEIARELAALPTARGAVAGYAAAQAAPRAQLGQRPGLKVGGPPPINGLAASGMGPVMSRDGRSHLLPRRSVPVLFDTTQLALERAIEGAGKRHEALAANLANANTPGYQRVDVDFHGALASAIGRGDAPGAELALLLPGPRRVGRRRARRRLDRRRRLRVGQARRQRARAPGRRAGGPRPHRDPQGRDGDRLMSLFGGLEISGSALTAERLRMDVMAENLANAQTTRGADGNPYRRKEVVLQERAGSFGASLSAAMSDGTHGRRRRGRRRRRGPDAAQARLRPGPPGRRRRTATSPCRTSTPSPRWST